MEDLMPYRSRDNPKHRRRDLTARQMRLIPRDTPVLPGRRSRRVRRNRWVPA